MTRPARAKGAIKGIQTEMVAPISIDAPDPLKVDYLPGRGNRLVVSFAGVGRVRKLTPPHEFIGTASQDGENHVLFVSDKSRSWMNGPGIADSIVRLVKQYRDFHAITEIVALGNSMGGFSALVLADLMPIDTVISFSPQFSACQDMVPEEIRWSYYRDQIDRWLFADIGEMQNDRTEYYLFHADAENEAIHWMRFPHPAGHHHFVVLGQNHGLVRTLSKRGLLAKVVDQAIARKPKRVRKALERGFLDRHMAVMRREVYEKTFPDIMSRAPARTAMHPGMAKGQNHDQVR